MSASPDSMKIFSPNLVGRCVTAMRCPHDENLPVEVNVHDVISDQTNVWKKCLEFSGSVRNNIWTKYGTELKHRTTNMSKRALTRKSMTASVAIFNFEKNVNIAGFDKNTFTEFGAEMGIRILPIMNWSYLLDCLAASQWTLVIFHMTMTWYEQHRVTPLSRLPVRCLR